MRRFKQENQKVYSSYRVRKTAQARIICSPQMPADFFGHHQSLHIEISKPKIFQKKCENQIFDQFISMFKMSRGLKKLAKKLNEENLQKKQKIFIDGDKQNLRLPSIKNIQKRISKKNTLY